LKPFMAASEIEAQGIDPKRRAETLSLEEFVKLADTSLLR
jgi:16S rRNA A1518/A1519 N6-dimethyltransferase RsmA/KsgA/DIM1 with predicted DNA glycosylase/AP lyase activity